MTYIAWLSYQLPGQGVGRISWRIIILNLPYSWVQLTENRLRGIRSLLLLAKKWLVTGIKLDCSGKYESETLKCQNHLSSPYHYLWLLTTGVFVIWHEARINFTYWIFYSAHTLWRGVLLSEWLVISAAFCFDALFSSHICFSHSLFSYSSCYPP